MSPDIINGCFELCGAALTLKSVVKLYRDKEVKGVCWSQVAFFTFWGLWNLFFYPHLNQWWSFAGGVALVIVNGIWLSQMLHYTGTFKKIINYLDDDCARTLHAWNRSIASENCSECGINITPENTSGYRLYCNKFCCEKELPEIPRFLRRNDD